MAQTGTKPERCPPCFPWLGKQVHASPSQPAAANVLYSGQELRKGQRLRSPNGLFSLIMQEDGNFVSYKHDTEPARATFHSNTWRQGDRAVLQSDGRLVVLDAAGRVVWSSGATPLLEDKYRLVLQNDGNAVIYNSADLPVSSNHACPAPKYSANP